MPSKFYLLTLAVTIASTPAIAKPHQTNTTVYRYVYSPNTTYAGSDFFSGFDFLDDAHPAGSGFASYVNQSYAVTNGLVTNGTNGAWRIGVDSETVLGPKDGGRKSVRLDSKISYTEGLFVADIAHMPGGICGVWPAFWMSGAIWPVGGELDIMEGVNTNTVNKITGYTNGTGSCTNAGAMMTDTLASSDCTDLDDTGCSMLSQSSNSYGTGFNNANGGVYAVEWHPLTGIKVWFFPRSDIPSDVSSSSQSPDPTTWGTPSASIPATDCDMSTHFYNMQLVLNTNFCGGWSNRTWVSSGCGGLADTCEEYVRSNPDAFGEAYWEVNYIKSFSGQNESTVVTTNTTTSAARSLSPPRVLRWLGRLMK